MPVFSYKAKDEENKDIKGKIEAPNLDVAAKILSDENLLIINVKRVSRIKFIDNILNKILNNISLKDILIFLRQLSVLISANIPLVRSLHMLENQVQNKALKVVVTEIADDVEGGSKLSESMARYPDIFNNFYINIIKSGETSGKLDEVLNYLADEQEKDYDMLKKIKGAMIYPIFISVGLIVVGIVMMVFVVPKLAGVLKESGVELPMSTKILLATSDFFVHFWWLVIIGFIGIIFIFRVLVNLKQGREYLDILKLHLPVFGKLLQKIYLVRFTRSFCTLIVGGVSIVKSLNVVMNIVDNVYYQNLIKRTIKSVEDGNSIASEFCKESFIPPMFSQMLSIGEETGRMPQVLDKVSDFYSREIENVMRNLMTLLEPVIMVIMGVAVGIMVAAIILPMYNLASGF